MNVEAHAVLGRFSMRPDGRKQQIIACVPFSNWGLSAALQAVHLHMSSQSGLVHTHMNAALSAVAVMLDLLYITIAAGCCRHAIKAVQSLGLVIGPTFQAHMSGLYGLLAMRGCIELPLKLPPSAASMLSRPFAGW